MTNMEQHSTPETSSEERMHTLTKDCWCNPTVVDYSDGTVVVDHKKPKNEDGGQVMLG